MVEGVMENIHMQRRLAYQERVGDIANILTQKSEKVGALNLHNMAPQTASVFHENWREPRAKRDDLGKVVGYTPRWKPTQDTKWIETYKAQKAATVRFQIINEGHPEEQFLNRNTYDADIANLSYPNLPEDIRAENKAAAEFIFEYLQNKIIEKVPINEDFIEKAAEAVHDAWKERNAARIKEQPELGTDYKDLTQEEKNRDIEQVVLALETIHNAVK